MRTIPHKVARIAVTMTSLGLRSEERRVGKECSNESISIALEETEASGILHTSFIFEAIVVPSEVFISWFVSLRG